MCNGRCSLCSMKPRPHWGDECMTDEQDEQRTAAYLRQVDQANADWIEWSKIAPIEWAIEEGLPTPVVQAIAAELEVDWV